MVNSAGSLVLVSRSGSVNGKVKELISKLALGGANILIRRCQVSGENSVLKLIRNDLVGMPKIRGAVHGAMILHEC
jgi:hypothetical protein